MDEPVDNRNAPAAIKNLFTWEADRHGDRQETRETGKRAAQEQEEHARREISGGLGPFAGEEEAKGQEEIAVAGHLSMTPP
jgi:hypothetical protein